MNNLIIKFPGAANSMAPLSTSTTTTAPSSHINTSKEERRNCTPKSHSTPTPKTPKLSTHQSSSRSSVIMSSPPTMSQERAIELPYMGEITLDSKPRRGRKPKKADICHLIYKNYGTVFPSPKTPEPPTNLAKPKISWTKDVEEKKKHQTQKSLAWTKTTGSLLEKRLTGSSSLTKPCETSAASSIDSKRESLQNGACDKLSRTKNKCDVNSSLDKKDSAVFNLCSGSKLLQHDNSGTSDGPLRDPNLAQACVQRLLAYAAGLNEQNEPLNLCVRDTVKVEPSSFSDSDPEELAKLSTVENAPPSGFVFWPSAGVFVHPQLLYKPTTPPSPPAPVPSSVSPKPVKKKRKRSAIFIPPAESPTEVSICKFKFTGGAKPSLEEKKMLSVDAGGNFRFYSGTDKGMRSFLPHLQHPNILSSSSSPPNPQKRLSFPSTDDKFPAQSSSSTSNLPLEIHPSLHLDPPSPQDQHSLTLSKRKRRSRKSEVREKLEQTFKEKGFLIQTQQLESAEGATYCKFRQLRKFTRYLFRSWRDYLPHSVQDLSQANQQQQQQLSHHEITVPSSCESSLPSSP
jgi:hypothetical protein